MGCKSYQDEKLGIVEYVRALWLNDPHIIVADEVIDYARTQGIPLTTEMVDDIVSQILRTDPEFTARGVIHKWIPVAEMYDGATPPAAAAYVTHANGTRIQVRDFDDTAQEELCFVIKLPGRWNAVDPLGEWDENGGIALRAVWMHNSTQTGSAWWGFKVHPYGDGDFIDYSHGGYAVAIDNNQGVAHEVLVSPITDTGGGLSDGDILQVEVSLRSTGSLTGDCRLIGVEYWITAVANIDGVYNGEYFDDA